MRQKSKSDLLALAARIQTSAEKCLGEEIDRLTAEASYLKSISAVRFPGLQSDAESAAADIAAEDVYNLVQNLGR